MAAFQVPILFAANEVKGAQTPVIALPKYSSRN